MIARHALVIWALAVFDVHHRHHHHHRMQVELVPLDIAPPPVMSPPPEPAVAKVQTPMIASPPIEPPPAAVQRPVVSAPVPAPPAPPAAAAMPDAPIKAEAPPILPPDGTAANLGNSGPAYPMQSRRLMEEGTVRLRVLISPQGRVEDISVAKSSGFDRLDKAALDAVRE